MLLSWQPRFSRGMPWGEGVQIYFGWYDQGRACNMKVAIIGAGASGLTCIKTCIEEGLEPVCFEQEDEIGGLWRFTERESHSSVYRSTVINTSKEMMCFSDFPIPKDFPNFMHHSRIMEYFHMYAKHFDLYKHIRFRHKVAELKRAADFDETGAWEISYQDLESDKPELIRKEVFGAVMLCHGHHASPSWPSFPGMDKFKGTQMHSHSYKDFKGFENKSVLIVGIGNSGGDIAVELSRHASKVYLSTRRGAWVLSRLGDNGKPLDHFTTRFHASFPRKLVQSLIKGKLNGKFDHANFGLQPEHPFMSQHPMVNDDLPHRITTGALTIKPNVSHFTDTGVFFEDGSSVQELDAVVFCTGYGIGFDFVDQSIVPVKDNEVTLYKYVFPPHLFKCTLAVIGCFQPVGALMPISELQARWSTRAFKGILKLPSQKAMEEEINQKKEAMRNRYYASKRHTIQVDYIGYSDELAELIGCKPNLWRLMIQDPALALRCIFHPCVPPQFRLMGPGAWPGAKKAIQDLHYNTVYPTKTRVIKQKETTSWGFTIKFFVLLFVILALLIVRWF